jgi:hypothetical protein
MIRHKPDIRHFTLRPVLGILATAEVTLGSLIGGLRDLFPEIEDGSPYLGDSSDVNNDARAAVALAQALQVMVTRLCAEQLHLVDPSDDDIF